MIVSTKFYFLKMRIGTRRFDIAPNITLFSKTITHLMGIGIISYTFKAGFPFDKNRILYRISVGFELIRELSKISPLKDIDI